MRQYCTKFPSYSGCPYVAVVKIKKNKKCRNCLALSLLVSRIRLADDVQVSVVSLSGLSSNDLQT